MYVNAPTDSSEAPAQPIWIRLQTFDSDEAVDQQALVLRALGIPHGVRRVDATFELWVAPEDEPRARRALEKQARDEAEGPAEPMAAPDRGPSTVGILMAVGLLAFFWVTGQRDGGDRGSWFGAGEAVAEKIVAGQWWRATTALTLHADLPHVFGNGVAAVIFVGALGRWLGGGLAAALIVFVGTLGNLAVAYYHHNGHNSVGASTATFGALGLLGGLQFHRWFSGQRTLSAYFRRRRALTIIAACLGLFAMLGVGERADVGAHLAGMGLGVGTGIGAGPLGAKGVNTLGQGVLAVAALAAVVMAWRLARG